MGDAITHFNTASRLSISLLTARLTEGNCGGERLKREREKKKRERAMEGQREGGRERGERKGERERKKRESGREIGRKRGEVEAERDNATIPVRQ